MNRNMLKLIKDRTEFIVFPSKQHVKKTESSLKLGSRYINSSKFLRYLRIILDNALRIEKKQVNCICESCYYQIGNILLIRKYINNETCRTLV